MEPKSFIGKTGQLWKATLMAILSVLGLALMGTAIVRIQHLQPIQVLALMVGAMAMCVLMLIVALSIQCPECRVRLYWRAMTKLPFEQHARWVYDVRCPNCGFIPDGSTRR